MIRTAAMLLAGLLLLAPGLAPADESDHSLEQLVVEMAESPAQHRALAAHFRSKADGARDEARRHEKMGKSYNRGKATEKAAKKRHCRKISEHHASLAEEYDALAALHERHARGE